MPRLLLDKVPLSDIDDTCQTVLTCRDINMVNGVPWPVMSIQAKWHRFRVLNSAPSRPYILQVCADDTTASTV